MIPLYTIISFFTVKNKKFRGKNEFFGIPPFRAYRKAEFGTLQVYILSYK
jgi:hypothetical protein